MDLSPSLPSKNHRFYFFDRQRLSLMTQDRSPRARFLFRSGVLVAIAMALAVSSGQSHAGEPDFRTLDMKPVANMDWRDEVWGDGKGGWTDQGDNDLREIARRPRELLGVPFELIDPGRQRRQGRAHPRLEEVSRRPLQRPACPGAARLGASTSSTLPPGRAATWPPTSSTMPTVRAPKSPSATKKKS